MEKSTCVKCYFLEDNECRYDSCFYEHDKKNKPKWTEKQVEKNLIKNGKLKDWRK